MAAPQTKTPSHTLIDLRNEFAQGAHEAADQVYPPSIGFMILSGLLIPAVPDAKFYALAGLTSVVAASGVNLLAVMCGKKEKVEKEHPHVYKTGRVVGALAPLALASYVGYITYPLEKSLPAPEVKREVAPANATPQELQNRINSVASQGGLQLTYL